MSKIPNTDRAKIEAYLLLSGWSPYRTPDKKTIWWHDRLQRYYKWRRAYELALDMAG